MPQSPRHHSQPEPLQTIPHGGIQIVVLKYLPVAHSTPITLCNLDFYDAFVQSRQSHSTRHRPPGTHRTSFAGVGGPDSAQNYAQLEENRAFDRSGMPRGRGEQSCFTLEAVAYLNHCATTPTGTKLPPGLRLCSSCGQVFVRR